MNFSSDPVNNLENLHAKNKTKSISIYFVVLLALFAFLALLPIIKVDISSQSRGIIRSKTDNVPLTSIVSGIIIWININITIKLPRVIRYKNRQRRFRNREKNH